MLNIIIVSLFLLVIVSGIRFFLPIFEPEISKTFCVLYISQRYSVEKSYTDNRVLCMIDRREFLKRQISPMYMPLANTLAFLGRPLDRLVLGINPSGAIAKVVNQEEIAEQWRQLKQTDEAHRHCLLIY